MGNSTTSHLKGQKSKEEARMREVLKCSPLSKLMLTSEVDSFLSLCDFEALTNDKVFDVDRPFFFVAEGFVAVCCDRQTLFSTTPRVSKVTQQPQRSNAFSNFVMQRGALRATPELLVRDREVIGRVCQTNELVLLSSDLSRDTEVHHRICAPQSSTSTSTSTYAYDSGPRSGHPGSSGCGGNNRTTLHGSTTEGQPYATIVSITRQKLMQFIISRDYVSPLYHLYNFNLASSSCSLLEGLSLAQVKTRTVMYVCVRDYS
jgi:hypothetical protein